MYYAETYNKSIKPNYQLSKNDDTRRTLKDDKFRLQKIKSFYSSHLTSLHSTIIYLYDTIQI